MQIENIEIDGIRQLKKKVHKKVPTLNWTSAKIK